MSTADRPLAPLAPAFELTRREKIFTIAGTLLGLFLAALDQTIVGTAGPAMQRDLEIAPSLYPWITTAYLVASTVMVPIYGKLSDLFGRKRILLVGIALFLVGSLLCGLSRTAMTLIASRALQGLGSAALFTSAFAVVADIFPPAERGRYQGIFGGAFALSSIVGPLIGGFLTDHLSWHWVFFVNLPLGAIAIGFIVTRMPSLHRPRLVAPKVDVPGALALIVAVVPFLVALSSGRTLAAHRGLVPALYALSLAGLVGFLVLERRAPEPLLDLDLFKNRTFAIGNFVCFVLGAAFLGSIVFLPLFMVNVVGVSATNAGMTMVPLTFGILAGNVGSGQLVSRMGRYKPLMIAGNVVLLVGFVVMAFTLRPDSGQAEVTTKMVLLGLGLGPSIPLFTIAIQNAVDPRHVGVATAAATFSRQIGSTIGVTVLGAVFAITLARESASVHKPAELAGIEPPQAGAAVVSEGGASVRMHVDVPAYRAVVEAKHRDDPLSRERALAALASWDRETRRAFTTATVAIYKWGLAIALIGAVFTFFVPQLPLRKTNQLVAKAE